MKKRIYVLWAVVSFSLISYGQSFEYGLVFEGIADNREFFSGYSASETILGSRLSFDAGTSIDSIHSIRAGLSYFYEFGTAFFFNLPVPLLYYSLKAKNLTFTMGAFPRNRALPFPEALVSEKYRYFHPAIEGLSLLYQSERKSANLFIDWQSRIDSTQKEQFMAGLAGTGQWGGFLIEGYGYLFHDRPNLSRPSGEFINDYLGACIMAGYDFSKHIPLDRITLKTGLLASLYRNRGNGSGFVSSTSFYSEIQIEYKGFGITSWLNIGGPHTFSHGDPFYNSTSNYWRTNVYFIPIRHKRISGKLAWCFHLANGILDHSQQFILTYTFQPI